MLLAAKVADPEAATVETFADRLEQAMKMRGMTQEDVEREAGRSKGYVSRILSGDRKQPRKDSVASLAKALRVRAAWLLDGEGPPDAEVVTLHAIGPAVGRVVHTEATRALDEAIEEAIRFGGATFRAGNAIRALYAATTPLLDEGDDLTTTILRQMLIAERLIANNVEVDLKTIGAGKAMLGDRKVAPGAREARADDAADEAEEEAAIARLAKKGKAPPPTR